MVILLSGDGSGLNPKPVPQTRNFLQSVRDRSIYNWGQVWDCG